MLPVVKRLRRDARITQQKLADDFGKTVLTIKRWERGLSEPPFTLVCQIAKKYELNILRYTFSEDDFSEIIDRGFAEYAMKLEQGLYLPCETLFVLNERDWDAVQNIRNAELAERIADVIWNKVGRLENHLAWGPTPKEAAKAIYEYLEDDRIESLAKADVISNLEEKLQPFFLLP